MTDLLTRIRVVLTALPTLIGAASTVVTALLTEYGDDWPWLAQWGPVALTWLGAAIVIVRTVTPVAKDDRGLI